MSAPIEIHNLKKKYGHVEALKGVSLSMKDGEILGLLGPNGAGKTTLISILTSLENADSGEISLFGKTIEKDPKLVKNYFGLVPQELVSHGFFSVWEVLKFVSGYHGITKNEEHITFLLQRMGLWDHRQKRVSQLSGGMKRRFAIAKALVHKPKLLLLDEPTAGVDIELRATLWSFVKDLNKQGTSVLLTTHYLEEAEELCDRIAVIDQGLIRTIGPTHDLIRALTSRKVVISLKASLPKCDSQYVLSQSEKEIVLQLPSSMVLGEVLETLKAEPATITDIRIQEGRLEEAVLAILGGGK